jgi:hypothetical protein
MGKHFASHDTVNHSKDEYVRYRNEVTNETRPDGKPLIVTTNITTNTVEGYYSVFKRGMKAFTSIAQRSTCTAISQNSTSVIPTASHWALTIRNGERVPSRTPLASV